MKNKKLIIKFIILVLVLTPIIIFRYSISYSALKLFQITLAKITEYNSSVKFQEKYEPTINGDTDIWSPYFKYEIAYVPSATKFISCLRDKDNLLIRYKLVKNQTSPEYYSIDSSIIDTRSAKFLNCSDLVNDRRGYVIDSQNAYYIINDQTFKMDGVNPKELRPIQNISQGEYYDYLTRDYMRDDNYVYYQGQIVPDVNPDADPDTYVINKGSFKYHE